MKHPGKMTTDVVAVFRHPPGRGGRTESYIVGDVRGVLANIAWGEKKLGEFVEIVPAWEGCPTSEFYVLVWSFSLKSKAARSMAAREELKRLLPKKLHRLISLARKYNRLGKRFLLEMGEKTEKTKAELFTERVLTDEERSSLLTYIAPMDFWGAATGRVEPHEVAMLVTHQLGLEI